MLTDKYISLVTFLAIICIALIITLTFSNEFWHTLGNLCIGYTMGQLIADFVRKPSSS